ncbi:hypothetical protein [Desulfosporosinus metallidurans]|uniref:Uncharacterized protein n=1 Tax=Desulfosporosinus metallidurans TaxID=1888891 RepID=A0A1Q8QHR6_9FIRM|nr:hypothetical protein [Desulfosporosinus metallidurans]OLN26866.1 hypothetical protein DSOL_4819 [Desulfosporosinus metallidurans]
MFKLAILSKRSILFSMVFVISGYRPLADGHQANGWIMGAG